MNRWIGRVAGIAAAGILVNFGFPAPALASSVNAPKRQTTILDISSSSNGSVSSEPNDPVVKWTDADANVAGPLGMGPLVIGKSGMLYAGGVKNGVSYLYGINQKGSMVWKCHLNGVISHVVVGTHGQVYAVTADNQIPTLYAMNSSGHMLWRLPLSNSPIPSWTVGMIVDLGTLTVNSQGNVFVIGALDNEPTLFGITGSGKVKWKLRDPGLSLADALLAGGRNTLYVLGNPGATMWDAGGKGYLVQVVNEATGKFISKLNVYNGSPRWQVASGGSLYYAGNHTLYAISSSGTVKWKYKLPSKDPMDQMEFFIDAQGDSVVLNKNSSTVVCLTPQGHVKWKVSGAQHGISDMGVPAVGRDGSVYINCDTSGNSGLWVLNKNGSEKMFTLSDWISGPSFGGYVLAIMKNDVALISMADGLVAVNPDGTVRWRYVDSGADSSHYIDSFAVSSYDEVYIGTRYDVECVGV